MRFASSSVALSLLAACGSSDPAPLRPTDGAAIRKTLDELAAFGEKHVGTDPGARAGDYVKQRMIAAGLADVHGESFGFPRHDVSAQALAVTIDGAAAPMGFDVFEGSGSGSVDAEVIDVGSAQAADLAGRDLVGKVALVVRNPSFHRSTQYLNVAAAGALAMLYVSAAPDNLRQVGSVRRNWEAIATIPTVSIGADDGAKVRAAIAAGKKVRAQVAVTARVVPGMGTNVIGRIVGDDPGHLIVVGAHYDSWFIGSTDNGGGVAALLALAERRAKEKRPRYTLVFVGYDGEEVALYGGYHYLRTHIAAGEPVLAVLNFEVPSAVGSKQKGLARSNVPVLDDALRAGDLENVYTLYAGLELVPALFGGIIPTDIQGTYRAGVPTASTACDSPYYHTTGDTPERVDTPMLATAVDDFDLALSALLASDLTPFTVKDNRLWRAETALRPGDAQLFLDVTVTDASGAPQPNAPVGATLLVDDFFPAATATGTTDARGKATLALDAAAAAKGSGNRWVHVTSGPMWPLVERAVSLQ